jgi:hypothetical protein
MSYPMALPARYALSRSYYTRTMILMSVESLTQIAGSSSQPCEFLNFAPTSVATRI